MSQTRAGAEAVDHDVAIVGGGPAGCSAGVFTARYGLDTAVFDRGRSSLRQCAYLENFLGFPGGIDVETFYDLIHSHARVAGCDIVPAMITSVDRRDNGDGDDGDGFVVHTQDGETVTARRVIAATRYDGEYMRGLDADEAMFDTYEWEGETNEQFARDYADGEGRTPVDGLYVASPSAATDRQAIMAAGRGARTAHSLIEDVRQAEGLPEGLAALYDWVRREDEHGATDADREYWREHFAKRLPDDGWLDDADHRELREREIDRRLESYVSDGEIEEWTRAGRERLADHLANDAFLAAVDDERLLDLVDDEALLEAAREVESDVAARGDDN